MSLTDHTATMEYARFAVSNSIREAGYKPLFKRPTGSAYYGKENPQDFDILVFLRAPNGFGDPDERDLDDGLPGHAPGNLEDFVRRMVLKGWTDCGEDGNTSGGNADAEDYRVSWCALRRDLELPSGLGTNAMRSVNIIATTDIVWFYRQVGASEVCKAFAVDNGEVLDKDGVIGLFRCIREGINPYAPKEG